MYENEKFLSMPDIGLVLLETEMVPVDGLEPKGFIRPKVHVGTYFIKGIRAARMMKDVKPIYPNRTPAPEFGLCTDIGLVRLTMMHGTPQNIEYLDYNTVALHMLQQRLIDEGKLPKDINVPISKSTMSIFHSLFYNGPKCVRELLPKTLKELTDKGYAKVGPIIVNEGRDITAERVYLTMEGMEIAFKLFCK